MDADRGVEIIGARCVHWEWRQQVVLCVLRVFYHQRNRNSVQGKVCGIYLRVVSTPDGTSGPGPSVHIGQRVGCTKKPANGRAVVLTTLLSCTPSPTGRSRLSSRTTAASKVQMCTR
ncbi:uncharacterized protein LOC144003821 isoform X3 [Festucalex cinctus]